MAEYVIKKLTESVTMQSVPQAVSKQLVTAEWINAVNDGFKQSINGNYALIKNQNEALVNVFSGHEQTGRSRFTGVFEAEVVGTGTVAELNIDFGLVETIELDDKTWWDKLLDQTVMFVYVKSDTSVEYLHLNCTFYTQSTTTEGLVYTPTEKTITLNLVDSLGEGVSAGTLYGHILPIKINTCVIEEDAVSFTAMSTADKIQSQIDELDAWIGLIELAADEAIDIAEAADAAAANAIINAETAQGHAEDAQAAAEEAAEDAEAALAQVTDKISTTQLSDALALKVDKEGAVTGIKGNAESTYRTGDVNITPANIGAIASTEKGAANGLAELDGTGKLASSQIPAGIDEMKDSYIVGETPLASDWLSLTDGGTALTPTTGLVYIVLTAGAYDHRQYRWSGTTYGEISASLAIGETSSTAYRGDRGKEAYEHKSATGNVHSIPNAVPTGEGQTDGLMTHEDKDKLNTVERYANVATVVTAGTFTVSVADWSAGTTCTKTITGLTANDDIMLCPTDETAALIVEFSVDRPTQDGADLDFTATTTPDENLVYDYHIYKGVRA